MLETLSEPSQVDALEQSGGIMRTVGRMLLFGAAVCAPVATILTIFRSDRVFQILTAALTAAAVLVVVLLLAVAWALHRWLRSPECERVSPPGALVLRAALLGAGVLVGASLIIPAGRLLHSHDIEVAKRWVESTATVDVVKFRSTHGCLPDSLELATDTSMAPYLWDAGMILYKHDGTHFSFDVVSSLYSGEVWGSSFQAWLAYD